MGRYKQISGKHEDAEGVRYNVGAVVESDMELDVLFVNKFKRLDDSKKKKAAGPELEEEESILISSKPKNVVESEEVSEEEDSSESEESLSIYGEEVTDSFTNASKAGFRVFKDVVGYHVLKDDGKEPLNSKPLTTKSRVREFLQEQG